MMQNTQDTQNLPDERGRFGEFGGRFVPETLMSAVEELEREYIAAQADEEFQAEMAERRLRMKDRNDFDVGCPLCWAFVEENFERPAADGGGGLQ